MLFSDFTISSVRFCIYKAITIEMEKQANHGITLFLFGDLKCIRFDLTEEETLSVKHMVSL